MKNGNLKTKDKNNSPSIKEVRLSVFEHKKFNDK